MKRKVICVLMTIVLIMLSGCTTDSQQSEQVDLLLTEYLKNVDEYDVPTREFGEPTSFVQMGEKTAIGILYPETDIKFLDNAIVDWIDETVDTYNEEVDSSEASEATAELTVSYESYYVGKSVVGIKMSGTFFSSSMAHPIDVIKTFNADTKEKEFLEIEDVLKKEAKSDFVDMLAAKAGIEAEFVDDNILDNGILTKEGIEIILNRGDYLPMSDGTKTLFFAYTEIADLLAKDFDYQPRQSEMTAQEKMEPTDGNLKKTIDPEKPMLALTFDDGPSAHTERLLDIFKEHGGSGTFFVLGNLIDKRENILKRADSEGHEIANHTWDHRQLTNLSEEEITDQLMMTRAKIYDVIKKDSLVVRPPYGAYDDTVLAVGGELGFSFVNWSVDTLDWQSLNAQAIYDEIINNASDGAIVLCHDLHGTTVDAMEAAIPKLIEDGYQLVTVSELMSYSENQFAAGEMYCKQ